MVVEAAAGLGKTALLDRAASLAVDAGYLVRRAAPAPLECHFSSGVLRALLEAPLGARLDDAGADSTQFAHEVLWLCSELAAKQPLALIVDDAQWADQLSLEVLAYLARRVEDVPLLIVLATREADPQLSLFGNVTVLHPASADAARHRAADRARRRRLRVPPGDRRQPVAAGRARRGRDRGRRGGLAVGARRGAPAYGGALAARPRRGRGAGGDRRCGPARRRRGRRRAGRRARAGPRRLQVAGLLDPGGKRFAHALIAAAITDELTPTERERLHREAARALMAVGADARAGRLAPARVQPAQRSRGQRVPALRRGGRHRGRVAAGRRHVSGAGARGACAGRRSREDVRPARHRRVRRRSAGLAAAPARRAAARSVTATTASTCSRDSPR